MNDKIITRVSDLVGEEIAAICFVRDYVEFRFDGPIVRSLANPIILHGGQKYVFPNTGSRDALCALIGSQIIHLSIVENDQFEMKTSSGSTIIISLFIDGSFGPEAMHFMSGETGHMDIW